MIQIDFIKGVSYTSLNNKPIKIKFIKNNKPFAKKSKERWAEIIKILYGL